MRSLVPLILVAGTAFADGVARYNDPLPPRPRPEVAARLGDLVRQAAARGGRPSPEWDPRLEAALADVLRYLPPSGPPPNELVQEALHLQGIVEPSPHLVVASVGAASDEALAAELADKLPAVLEQGRYRRMGVAVDGRGRILIGLQESFLALAPVPRRLPPGGAVTLDGRLLPPYTRPELFITSPDGHVVRQALEARGDGGFRAPFRCGPLAGRHQVEIAGEDRFGLAVLANFPIYCGAAPPTALAPIAAAESKEAARPWTDAADAEAQVFALVNQDRARAGLPPLALDPALSAVARAHSADMRDHHFFGHVSPTTGNADDRLKHAGIQVPLVLENVGRAYSPLEAERGLMDSPGHRGNILSPRAERVGVGVAVAPASTPSGVRDLFVTQLFVRLAERFDKERAPEELRARVTALRRDAGLPPLADDADLDAVAREVADGIARGELSAQNPGGPVEHALARLGGYQSLRTVVARAAEVAQIGNSQALLDRAATHAGVAAVAGPPDPAGRPLVLVIVLGARR